MRLAMAITGLGMRSSIGMDAAGACAALRAGIVRAREVPDVTILNEDGTPEHPIAHPVETVRGFQGKAKLLALAMPAFKEVLAQGGLQGLPLERTGLYLALPPRLMPQAGGAREGSRELLLCDRLVQWASLSVPRKNQREFWLGHAGVPHALEQACQELAAGRLERCILGGVDSLLDSQTVQALHQRRRLKSQDAPDGLQPGEAAAFFVLEPLKSALQRRAQVHGLVTGVAFLSDESREEQSVPGAALGHCVTSLLSSPSMGERAWFISDLNGEPSRSMEWGNLLVRLTASHPGLRQAPLWHPASSLGDTGTASAAIGLCAVVRAFTRKYAPAEVALVLSSSDGPARGAIRVERYSAG